MLTKSNGSQVVGKVVSGLASLVIVTSPMTWRTSDEVAFHGDNQFWADIRPYRPLTTTTSTGQSAVKVNSQPRIVVAEDLEPTPPMITIIDPLDRRFAAIEMLADGWDGLGSKAPGHAAVAALRDATARMAADRRQHLGASPHADGYIAVTLEKADETRYADIYADHVEYEIYPSDNPTSTGQLDVGELARFFAA